MAEPKNTAIMLGAAFPIQRVPEICDPLLPTNPVRKKKLSAVSRAPDTSGGPCVTERRTTDGWLPSGGEWDRVVQRLKLSCRQAEIVRALLCNMTVPEAARVIGIRPDTVKTYLKRTYRRLDVTTRVELALRVMAAAQPDAALPFG